MADFEKYIHLEGTFGQCVRFLLFEHGTRPYGAPEKIGRRWTEKEFADAVGVDQRAVRYWLSDQKVPQEMLSIERVLFGDNERYDTWRKELRAAYHSKKEFRSRRSKLPDQKIVGRATIAGNSLTKSPLLYSLPRLNPDFIGRKAVIKNIKANIIDNNILITALEGMAGIGKTTTAIQAVRELKTKDVFRDGVLFIDLGGFSQFLIPKTPKSALAELLRPFFSHEFVMPSEFHHLKLLWNETLSDKNMLIILDNARDETQIEPFLVDCDGCRFLITSRRRLAIPGVQTIEIDLLAKKEAIQLAKRLANRRKIHRVSSTQAGQVARLCGYLPIAILSISNSIGVTKGLDINGYLERLDNSARATDAIKDAKAQLRVSIEALDDDTRMRWVTLGAFEGPFDPGAASAVWGAHADETLAKFEGLTLVLANDDGHYWLHDIYRAIAMEYLEADPSLMYETYQRHSRHYLNILSNIFHSYTAGGKNIRKSLQIFDVNRRQIEAGQAWAAAHLKANNSIAEIAWDYGNSGTWLAVLRFSIKQRLNWFETERAAAKQLRDRNLETYAMGNLSVTYYDHGYIAKSIEIAEETIKICEDLGVRSDDGRMIGNIAKAYAALENFDLAATLHETALDLFKKTNDYGSQCFAYGFLGRDYARLGNLELALQHSSYAIKLSRRYGNRLAEGWAEKSLGLTHLASGEADQAISHFSQAIAIARELGDKYGEGEALEGLGQAHSEIGDTVDAIKSYERQYLIASGSEDRRTEANALLNQSLIYNNMGNLPRAIELLENAIEIFERIEHPKAGAARAILAQWMSAGELH